jgi:hypothetical protein
MSQWQATSYVAKVVLEAGFEYEPAQDIIKSILRPPLQFKTGFTWAYDIASPFLSMIIDAEPFYFQYGSRHWLIELWKGQYGLETGCEIGVYYRWADGEPDRSAPWQFYQSSPWSLQMSSTLRRNGAVLFRRGPEPHWWLTGFKWGVFTPHTADLSMHIEMELLDEEMRDAFKASLHKRGYNTRDLGPKAISFDFSRPTWHQPGSRVALEPVVQLSNQHLVARYNKLKEDHGIVSNDPNQFNSWDAPAARAARQVVAGATAIGQEAARRLGVAGAAASRIAGAIAAAGHQIEHRLTDESWTAYRDIVGFFQKVRDRANTQS